MRLSDPKNTSCSRRRAAGRVVLACAVAPLLINLSVNAPVSAATVPASVSAEKSTVRAAVEQIKLQVVAYVAPALPVSATTSTSSAPSVAAAAPLAAEVVAKAATGAPKITLQPTSVVLKAGGSAAFLVSASGAGTVTYQWSKNSVPIAGATSAGYVQPSVARADSGASYSVVVKNAFGTTVSSVARVTVNAAVAQAASAARPFSDQSPWNSRPTKFTLGTSEIPTSTYWPAIGSGPYSVAAAIAAPSDPAMVVMGPVGKSGISIADANEVHDSITIPHWPANVTPATGTDGHADIIDVAADRIHSFWQLAKVNGQWRAAQYSWTPLAGSGWGTPAQTRVGARAAGVSAIAGVIRVAEIDDGLPTYKHALAMSLTENGLSATTPYVFPATSADSDAQTTNSGQIPEGALMMLPPDFDVSTISDPRLKKVAETLKTFGAYVIDRNVGTPIYIYAENGSNVDFMNGYDWGTMLAVDLIRSKLRVVTSTSEWVDANGAVYVPNKNLNLLSMRGWWHLTQGSTVGTFDTWQQAVVFPSNGQKTVQQNTTGSSMPSITWATPQAGKHYKLTVTATGGATMRFILAAPNGNWLSNSGELANAATTTITWPATTATPNVFITSGPQGGGTISATLVCIDP